jgi:hypothetical protein
MESGLIKEILASAEEQVTERNKSISHKVSNKLYYSLRKGIKHSAKYLSKPASYVPVPGFGTVMDFAWGKLVEKVVNDRNAKKLQIANINAAYYPTPENLRKAFKYNAKSFKDIAERIERNQPKLKDAVNKLISDNQDFSAKFGKGTLTSDEVWNVAYDLQDVKHYENKILAMIVGCKEILKTLEDAIIARQGETKKFEESFVDALLDYKEAETPETPLLDSRMRSSSFYDKGKKFSV